MSLEENVLLCLEQRQRPMSVPEVVTVCKGDGRTEDEIRTALGSLASKGLLIEKTIEDLNLHLFWSPSMFAEKPSNPQTPGRQPMRQKTFLTPRSSVSKPAHSADGLAALEKSVALLREQNKELDEELASLAAYDTGELEGHIQILHDYNELKDAGQTLLGQLALNNGVTTVEMYQRFALDVED